MAHCISLGDNWGSHDTTNYPTIFTLFTTTTMMTIRSKPSQWRLHFRQLNVCYNPLRNENIKTFTDIEADKRLLYLPPSRVKNCKCDQANKRFRQPTMLLFLIRPTTRLDRIISTKSFRTKIHQCQGYHVLMRNQATLSKSFNILSRTEKKRERLTLPLLLGGIESTQQYKQLPAKQRKRQRNASDNMCGNVSGNTSGNAMQAAR